MSNRKTYKGKYQVVNVGKYIGKTAPIYRSLWERQVFKFLDSNPKVVAWGSENIVIPYYDPTSRRERKYYVDLFFKSENGKKYLIEIKPYKESVPPKKNAKFESKLLFAQNQMKWLAAKNWALNNNMEFQVWTENTLKKMGIKI